MTQYLPPNLLALFAAREPIPYFPPLDKLPWEKKPWPYAGVSQFMNHFEDPKDTPAPTRGETKEERTSRKQLEKEKRHKELLETKIESWDPSADPRIQGDPFKTIFVGRINYDTSESKLRRELEMYGPIKRITMVSSNGKPRGYAFIEYEKERDMHNAYKYADGKKIDGKRIVVDVERGRTVKSWKPRRLGGGLGGTRRGAPHECIKYSGRVDERDMRDSKNSRGDERERDRDRDKDRDKDRDRDRERDRERDRTKDRERDRDKDRDRDRDRDEKREKKKRSRSRDRDRDREEKREKRKRSRSRERKRDRSKDRKDRDKKERDRDREERKSRKEREKSHREYDGESERKKSRMESEEEGQIVENNGREMEDH